MVRTQVYLTENERAGLEEVGRVTGKKQSELIREAIDMFLDSTGDSYRDSVLNEAAGIWKSRDDLSEIGKARLSWNRGKK
ncbi:MAG TPA: ribbon-helix-helix domain-containing protein [Candidatus Sabulitectum sp.]|nr:ribbon-helix-helix domain-containing protein [Candidatus Sabulitectum sp.]HPJ28798.1 ribbon-helix-helix domain-containing protein [Candidatus Sabulitectum sp.]HPR23079.1 ribbon-helix-helix domain-containing protein [Candidatus Sabulitectum sp.]